MFCLLYFVEHNKQQNQTTPMNVNGEQKKTSRRTATTTKTSFYKTT